MSESSATRPGRPAAGSEPRERRARAGAGAALLATYMRKPRMLVRTLLLGEIVGERPTVSRLGATAAGVAGRTDLAGSGSAGTETGEATPADPMPMEPAGPTGQ